MLKFILIVTLVFGGFVYEYPVPMIVRDGKVLDSETGAEVKPARKADETRSCPNGNCPFARKDQR